VVPATDYDSGGMGANCVIGGLIPEGCGWTNALGGKLLYLFADHGMNWMHALEVKADRTGVKSSTAIEVGEFDSGTGVASFRQGPDAAVYIVMNAGNAVYRLTPKDESGPDCSSSGGSGGEGGIGGEAGESNAGGAPMSAGGVAGADETGGTAGIAGRAGTGSGAVAGTRSGGGSGGGSAGKPTTAGNGGKGGKPSGGGAGGTDNDDSDGCGCRTAGRTDAGLGAWAVAAALASVVARRRRRTPRA
jgi:MYXO-CTERM domain-containing protein